MGLHDRYNHKAIVPGKIVSGCFAIVFALLSVVVGLCRPAACQTSAELQSYFTKSIGLNQDQIEEIRKGKPVTKVMKSRTPADIIIVGAVYIVATPERYIRLYNDFNGLRELAINLTADNFSDPPAVGDLNGFSFEVEDVKELRTCKPGDCKIQLPAKSMEAYQKSIDWNVPDVKEPVNQLLRLRTIERLQSYQHDGNRALITYDDKDEPVNTGKRFESILSYAQLLPANLPDFHRYLLVYPAGRPANTQDMFYWANEKFGLKPTLRVVHVVTRQAESVNEPAYAIAEKQLYASHYFQTALNLTFVVRDADASRPAGFYLFRAMGSTQEGLTGFKGSIVRKKAVKQATSFLKESLQNVKNSLEKRGDGQPPN